MDIQYSCLLRNKKKCSFVQSLVTKIEHVPVLTGREESLNKRVNLALGHASVYFVILCSTIHKTRRACTVDKYIKIASNEIKTYSWKGKKGDGKYRKTWSHNFARPSSGNSVSVTDRCHSDLKWQVVVFIFFAQCLWSSYHSPPEGISISIKIWFAIGTRGVLFREIDEITGENQAQEAYVEGRDELLSMNEDHGAQ